MYMSVNILDTKIPQNKLKAIPNICVDAKPNTGPKPKINKINAVKNTVIWPSKIGANERR